MSTRLNTEISAVSHQSALHICFSATGWVCSIKLRDSSFTQRELAYILTSATCRSAWHVDIAESRAQDISTAFVMHFSRSWEKLFSFWKDKYSCPHRGPLPFQYCALEAAKFLRKFQAHSPYPQVSIRLFFFFFLLELVNLQSIMLGNFTPNIIQNAIRVGA